jgi:excisionase family DNA binding protein
MPISITLTLTDEQIAQIAAAVRQMNGPQATGRPMSMSEAAKELNVSRETIRLAVHAGKMKRVPGISAIRIPAAEVERMKRG